MNHSALQQFARRTFATEFDLMAPSADLALDHGLASQRLKVQHWLDEDDDVSENDYEGITCPACTRLHFLNRRTGKLLGHDDE